jgi:hypothetical protein
MRRYREQKNQRLRVRSDFEDGLIRQRTISWPDSGFPLWAVHAAARALRIGCKLSMGCYQGLGFASFREAVASEAEILLPGDSLQKAPDAVRFSPGSSDNVQETKRREKTMVTSA